MNPEQLLAITELRAALHACPERSGCEMRTKEMLQAFLREYTSLEICPCGEGFYAAHREENAAKPSLALRADYDALAQPGGGAAHLCGHDGHAAALCGAALALEEKTAGRNVFFLFQPAEETGAGAKGCCELLIKEPVGEIYGCHNLPGLPLGQVTTRAGTFACASRGVTLKFTGRPTHAATPENGLSPATAVGRLLCELPALAAPEQYAGMTLCTVIGVQMGEKAFGAAAAEAEVWLTLRGEHDADLEMLHTRVLACAETLAAAEGLGFAAETQDVFPSTENDVACAQKVLKICGGVPLEVPMRWSEDFGWYQKQCRGCFFGIGAGENHPGLHTEKYEYPDALLAPTVAAFSALIERA